MRDSDHNLSNTKIYSVWVQMKQRATNPSNKAYPKYGGCGKGICDSWKDFRNFYRDMGGTYKEGLTIERIDGTKGYYPENCKWADRFEQAYNRKSTRFYTYEGETHTIKEWALLKKIPYHQLKWRIRHWGSDEAIGRKFYTKDGRDISKVNLLNY